MVASFCTLIGFVGIFIKLGREKGESDAYQKEMRKDIEKNATDINALGSKVNNMEVENTRLVSNLSKDLEWIKSSLTEIKEKVSSK